MPTIVSLAVRWQQIPREDLLAQYAADNPLSAKKIEYTSRKSAICRCAYGHTETESPYKYLCRGYCKTCGRTQEGSFAQNYPEAAKKIRFYPPRSALIIQKRFCGSAIRDIYENAALRRNSSCDGFLPPLPFFRHAASEQKMFTLYEVFPSSTKWPGLSARTVGLNIKASYRIGSGAKCLTAHIVQGKNKAAANRTIPVDSLPLHFMISSASQSSHTYWPLWSTIFLYSIISSSLTTV